MNINKISVRDTLDKARALLDKEATISPALKSVIEVLLMLMAVMLERLSLNSGNSSKPPSSDPNRKKRKTTSKRKPGGQPGRVGTQLKLVTDPDKITHLKLDKRRLPKGQYTEGGYQSRQVIDFKVSRHVIEYRAQVLIDAQGKRHVAAFPVGVTRPVQYGNKTKATAVYLSQYQLLPYQRIEDYFAEQTGLTLSAGSLFNFNQEAYERLADFEAIAKAKLTESLCLHVDETGVNVNGKRLWLQSACNAQWTYFYPHEKRGTHALDAMGILSSFKGVLCHDHWKPYYRYDCQHALCNAHHLRELEWSATHDKQQWAEKLSQFLKKLNQTVDQASGSLTKQQAQYYRKRYRKLLLEGQQECPVPDKPRKKGQRGRVKQSKSRNLLDRLLHYQDDVLRFMTDVHVPFTNNQGENDLRMTKVQQKISGCFRSMEGAYLFCRIRAYLITCRKHNVSPTQALEALFDGQLPDFCKD